MEAIMLIDLAYDNDSVINVVLTATIHILFPFYLGDVNDE
jgi:hypothetical protein